MTSYFLLNRLEVTVALLAIFVILRQPLWNKKLILLVIMVQQGVPQRERLTNSNGYIR